MTQEPKSTCCGEKMVWQLDGTVLMCTHCGKYTEPTQSLPVDQSSDKSGQLKPTSDEGLRKEFRQKFILDHGEFGKTYVVNSDFEKECCDWWLTKIAKARELCRKDQRDYPILLATNEGGRVNLEETIKQACTDLKTQIIEVVERRIVGVKELFPQATVDTANDDLLWAQVLAKDIHNKGMKDLVEAIQKI